MAELNNEVVGLTTNGVDEDACNDMFGRIPDKDVNVIGDKSAASAIDGEDGMAVLKDISRTVTGDESGMECVVDKGRSSVDASHNSSSCSVDGDAEEMEESSNGVCVQSVNLTMEERIGYMEVQMSAMKIEVGLVKDRMVDVIRAQNDLFEHRAATEGRNVVTMAAFEKMVDSAVTSGTKYGVSRRYITRYLCEEHKQIDGRYLQKKLGIVLKKRLASNEYLLSDSLFKINKK